MARLPRDLTPEPAEFDEAAAERWLDDVVRWLCVPASDVDHPVMQKKVRLGEALSSLIDRLERDGLPPAAIVEEARVLLDAAGRLEFAEAHHERLERLPWRRRSA